MSTDQAVVIPEKTKSHEGIKIFFLYSLCFIITAIFSFGIFLVFKKTFLIEHDGFLQHYPLLVQLRTMVKSIVHGQGVPLWNHGIGWGNETIGNLSIIFTDPFNYIAAAFPIPYIDLGYSFAIVLRLYTAGLTMMVFLRYHRFSTQKTVIGGLSYAFSYWAVGVINHSFFMLPLILFPLVILGIDKVYDKKSPALLIISVALSFITYVYFAYMTGIGCLIYVVIKSFVGEDRKTIKEFLALIGRFCLYIGIACCIASPVLITMVYTLVNASKTSGLQEAIIPGIKEVMHFLPALVGDYEVHSNYSYIGANALLTATIPFMFKKGLKKNPLPVVMYSLLQIAVLIPLWGQVMNGFSYRMGRWCYILVFFFVYAGVDQLDSILKPDREDVKTFAYWTGILVLFCIGSKLFLQAISTSLMVVCLWNILCMVFLYFVCFYGKIRILPALIINISVCYCLIFSPFGAERVNSFLDQGQAFERYNASVLRAFSQLDEKNNDFFRVDYNQHVSTSGKYMYLSTPCNENLFWSARTLSGYLSTLNQNMLDFNRSLLNTSGMFRRMCIYSLDNRKILNQLLGVRYYLYEASDHLDEDKANGKVLPEALKGDTFVDRKEIHGVTVAESRWKTSLGYYYTNVMSQKDFDSLEPLDKELVLSDTLVVDDDFTSASCKQSKSEADPAIREVPCISADESDIKPDKNQFDVLKEDDFMGLRFQAKAGSEIYLSIRNLKRNHFSYEEEKERSLGKKDDWSRIDSLKYDVNHLDTVEDDYFECFVIMGNVSKRVVYPDGDAQGIVDNHDYLINLGACNQASGEIQIRFTNPGHYSFDQIKVLSLNQTELTDKLQNMSARAADQLTFGNDYIKGQVKASEDGILFLSIPYHPGWKVWVDGKQVKADKVDYCFTGIPIKAGNHDILLKFRPIAFIPSLILMMAGLVFTLFLHIRTRKRQKKAIEE